MSKVSVRFARKADCKAIFELICELALFEKARSEVITNVEQLERDGFGENPLFECLVAEKDKKVIGFSLFFTTYSTWKGPCLYLEDFAVFPAERNKGVGKLLFDRLLSLAKERKMKRFAWQVLDWNTTAIQFYEKYQTEFEDEWINCRIHFD